MKQLVILSGKGGTGKTSVAASFAHLASVNGARIKAVLADADVDAANLELVLSPEIRTKHTFMGGKVAVVDLAKCGICGTCEAVCRFDAVHVLDSGVEVDPIACEGCAACVYQCPDGAIRLEEQMAGHWFHSDSQYGPLFHAALRPAQENSGKLVMEVKQQAKKLAIDEGFNLVMVDGPPGIGCPVISAVSGADLALIVVEPTASGVHDMVRVLETVEHFRVRAVVCINKADIYPAGADEIEMVAQKIGIDIVGKIPYDRAVTEAMVQGEMVTAYAPQSPASKAISQVWVRIAAQLEEK